MKILTYLKKIFFLLLLIPVISFSQEKDVIIRITQDESSTKLTDFQSNLILKKRPFKFQVLLNHVEGVYVFASIRDSVYRFDDTSAIRDFSYLNLLALRESDKFNTNKELSISETGWSYWFYNDTTEWHSFTRKVVGMGVSGIVGTKFIRQLYDAGEGKNIKLKNISTPLYMYFVAVKDFDENGRPKAELLRRKVKIVWDDED